MKTVAEINTAILTGKFTSEDLTSISQAIQFARAQLTSKMVHTFRKGDTVKFTSTKRGVVVTGKVEKVKIKNVLVDCGTFGRWNVRAHLLSKV
jgi:hypothetical protein